MMLRAGVLLERALEPDDVELRCSYDLKPVPPRRRAHGAAYCKPSCKQTARNWRRRAARARGAS